VPALRLRDGDSEDIRHVRTPGQAGQLILLRLLGSISTIWISSKNSAWE
jgi:hypothetical protein